jgi:DNA-binding NarL/FixJ family response regulator
VTALGLEQVLEKQAWVHVEQEPPSEGSPSCVIICTDSPQDCAKSLKQVRKTYLDVPIVVFSLGMNLPLAVAALRAGARGFIHSGLQPEQILRALKVTLEGELAFPRKLLEYLIANGQIANQDSGNLEILSGRQREILELVGEGLTNPQIAKRLYLTESTVKQHLRSAYKLIGVRNRTEAARLVRKNDA